MISILLVDDHALVRDSLRFLLNNEEDMQVVGDADNGRTAVKLAQELCPDVVILDIAMPELNGIDASRQIQEKCPNTQVIILSMHFSSNHILNALRNNVRGYVLKEDTGSELVGAVRLVHAGGRYFSQRVLNCMVDEIVMQVEQPLNPMDRLSAREREVMQLVVEGKTSVEIGKLLDLSPKSVNTYRSRLMSKLGVGDSCELMKFALREGLAG